MSTTISSSSPPSILDRLPRWLLRIHGASICALGLANAGVSFRATVAPVAGPFRFLLENPAAEIGLLQAYLLMAAIGVVLFCGSFAKRIARFDALGIAAHAVPLLALVVFHPLVVSFMGPETVLMSAGIHVTFIALETLALFLQVVRPAKAIAPSLFSKATRKSRSKVGQVRARPQGASEAHLRCEGTDHKPKGHGERRRPRPRCEGTEKHKPRGIGSAVDRCPE